MKALEHLETALANFAPKPLRASELHEIVGKWKARKAIQLALHGGTAFCMRAEGHGSEKLYFRFQADMEAFSAALPKPEPKGTVSGWHLAQQQQRHGNAVRGVA